VADAGLAGIGGDLRRASIGKKDVPAGARSLPRKG
jgi:hypothetical protein